MQLEKQQNFFKNFLVLHVIFFKSFLLHKKRYGSTVKLSRRMQCSNVGFHTHENVAP